MLMAVSLAEKLGNKGLRAFSLHPGVIYTNLGNHVDWEGGDYAALRMLLFSFLLYWPSRFLVFSLSCLLRVLNCVNSVS